MPSEIEMKIERRVKQIAIKPMFLSFGSFWRKYLNAGINPKGGKKKLIK